RHGLAVGLDEPREVGLATDERDVVPSSPTLGAGYDGDETERRYRLGLSLGGDRLHGLDVDGVADERPRCPADQDLARWRRLLEPRRGVHRVASDEGLAGRRVARDDLPGEE